MKSSKLMFRKFGSRRSVLFGYGLNLHPIATMDQVPPPNYSWHNFPYPEDVQNAYRRLLSYVESEGPFDAVWGFSQGGAMAALLLLMHQTSNPGAHDWPFKMAIFNSTFLPYRIDSGSITWDLTEKGQLQATYRPGEFDASDGKRDVDWVQDSRTLLDYHMIKRVQEQLDFPVRLLLKYRPQDVTDKLTLPSVHIRGIKDPYFFVDDAVSQLFDTETAMKMVHRGGHHFPRYSDELVQFAELIIETVSTLT